MVLGVGNPFQADLYLLQPPLDYGQVGEDQLQVHCDYIPLGVNSAAGVGYTRPGEGADDIYKGIGAGKVRKQLAADGAILGQALYRGADINILDLGGYDFLRLEYFGQLLKARLRHVGNAYVGRLPPLADATAVTLGEGIKDGGLAALGQPDDADGKAHALCLSALRFLPVGLDYHPGVFQGHISLVNGGMLVGGGLQQGEECIMGADLAYLLDGFAS